MTELDADQELRQLFAEEATERLDAMTGLLMRLETSDGDPAVMAALFREAHTLKGSAAMVGLPAVSGLAHRLEDLLAGVRGGARPLTPELVDALLAGVERLGSIVPAAVAGQTHETEAGDAERALVAAASVSVPPIAALTVPPPRQPVPAEAAPDPPPPARAVVAAAPAGSERLAVPAGRLDELIRLVGETAAGQLQIGRLLHRALGRDPEGLEEYRAFTHVVQELQEVAMLTRMVPLSRAVPGLQRAVREVARITGKRATLEVSGGDTELDRRVLDQLADALLHLVRNAVYHGIEAPEARSRAGKDPVGVVHLDAEQRRADAIVRVRDDGRGIDLERVKAAAQRDGVTREVSDEEAMRLIFGSGFSTSDVIDEVSGRGVGLDVVRSRLDGVQGRVTVSSEPGAGTTFTIAVPLTLSVVPSLLVTAGGQRFALPMHAVAGIVGPGEGEHRAGGRPVVISDGVPVPVTGLAATLGLPENGTAAARQPVVLLAGHAEHYGFRVDGVLGRRPVVVKGLSRVLPRLPAVVGASVEPDGPILLLLDSGVLVERALGAAPGSAAPAPVRPVSPATPRRAQRVLVVDDATIVREVERSILEQAGYEVVTAGDGLEAMAVLANAHCDLVVSDIDMPRLDGLELTARIRATPRLAQVPVILVTSRADEDSRRRGLEVGADGYVVKSGFDREALLGLVQTALGER